MKKTLFRLSLPALACAAAIFTGSALGAFFAGTPAEAREHAPAACRDDAPTSSRTRGNVSKKSSRRSRFRSSK